MTTIGSLSWAERSGGRLSARERRALLTPMLKAMAHYAIGRLRLLFGLRSQVPMDIQNLRIPDSRLARAAETECVETLSPPLVAHSHRTFAFGWALATLDGVAVDLEHLYATSLLHDISLESPSSGCCFAVAASRTMHEVATRAGCDPQTSRHLAEAIALHITPGLDPARHPLAAALVAGALVDLAGVRIWHLDPWFVQQVIERHPRNDFKRSLRRLWLAEAKTFPSGRAATIQRFSRFTLFVQLAPFRDCERSCNSGPNGDRSIGK